MRSEQCKNHRNKIHQRSCELFNFSKSTTKAEEFFERRIDTAKLLTEKFKVRLLKKPY